MPMVASHTTDHNEIEYTFYAYEDIRFIHIERSDGLPPVKSTIVAESNDDQTMDCDGYYVGNEVYLGMCENGHSIVSGFRFDNIDIPQNATIKYAFITFSVDGPYQNEVNLLIYGDDSGDSLALPDYSLAGRATTEAFVAWNMDDSISDRWELTDNHANVAAKYSFTTPQLAPIIEEIVHRGDWAPENALTFLIKNNDASGSTSWRRVIAKERAESEDWPHLFPARLVVAYEGGEPTPTPVNTPYGAKTPSIRKCVFVVRKRGCTFSEELGEGTLHTLRSHQEKQRYKMGAAGERWQRRDLIFPNSIGNPIDPSNLRLDFNRLLEEAGLPKIRCHDLRHTAASLMLNNGVPPIVVSRILRLSKPNITLDLYCHLYQEMLGEAAKIMDDLVTPIKLDMSEFETHDAGKGRDEVHFSE